MSNSSTPTASQRFAALFGLPEPKPATGAEKTDDRRWLADAQRAQTAVTERLHRRAA
jgi:hypothetical protein